MTILEIGCASNSTVSILFDDGTNQIELSAYDDETLKFLNHKIEKMKSERIISSRIYCSQKDLLNLEGKYDVIVLKSVLGGIFREASSSINDVRNLLKRVTKHNLNDGGFIITCDNGKSIIEPILNSFGARKNKWRFFEVGEITVPDDQFCFGYFSFFSLASRFGILGKLLEEYFLFPLDLLASLLTKKHPTIIVSVITDDAAAQND